MNETLSNKLPLSLKLHIKRLMVGSVSGLLRLGVPLVRFAERVYLGAVTHGLDPHRSWDVQAAPRAPLMQQYGAADFLLLMDAMAGRNDRMPAADRPVRTSIILLCYNKMELTFQCLRSLLREVDLSTTEIIVVNNASTDETARLLSHFEGYIRLVNIKVNSGSVGGNNEGARHARGKYLVFLNNDTVVLPGWLEPLVETAEGDPRTGAVGSMFIYPDGRLQEAGAIVWKSGEAFHYGWGKSPEDRRFNFAREVDYCTSASLLVRKNLFDRLGGFDQIYAPISYEDVDICFGVRSLGYKVIYQPFSRIIHFEGATIGKDTGSGLKRYQVINRPRFYEKWRDTLEREHYASGEADAELAANRKRGPLIVVFDERVPSPDRDAGSARMSTILQTLNRWANVVFIPFNRPQGIVYERALWKLGIQTAHVVDYRRHLKSRNCTAVVLSRPNIGAVMIPRIRRISPQVKIVFDMVDAHFRRLEREYLVSSDANTLKEAKRYLERETRLAKACDLVWCNSIEDKQAMAEQLPTKPIEVITTIHEIHDGGQSFDERRDLLFIGNMAHKPNADGIGWFVRDILPLVQDVLPGVTLYIIGPNARDDVLVSRSDKVQVLGYQPEIATWFTQCRVFVAPLRFGAGTKGKVGEAMSYGLPVVTTSVGAEGFGLTNEVNIMIADDPVAFANCVVHLYTQRDFWEKIAASSRGHIAQHFTRDVIGRTINNSIQEIIKSNVR